METTRRSALGMAALALVLSACGGNYSGLSDGAAMAPGQARSAEAHFADSVQPTLGFCRTCHVPTGIAATHEDGRRFMLSPNPSEDYANLKASWIALGQGVESNRLLSIPSGAALPHDGGAPWPKDSPAYLAMKKLLSCWDRPADCTAVLAGEQPSPVAAHPLLGSARGGHAWFDFCEGKGDAVALPVDPRSLIRPGINAGKAVYYNAYWKDCHRDPAQVGEPGAPQTCGELRAQTEQGRVLLEGNGAVGAGWYFGGNATAGNLTAEAYNTLWQKWGFSTRPDNFDQLVAERYGMGMSRVRNPYPLPEEDPNATDGGSGQLPTGFTQLREADGRWTGNLGMTCHVCHSGQIDAPGLGALYGNANSLSEFGQITVDLGGSVASSAPLPLPVVVGKTRGTNNALALQLIVFLVTQDIRPADPNFIGFTALAPNGGSLDAPAWWNVGHRAVKFQDGFLAMDALRSDFGFFTPGPGPEGFDWIRQHVRAGDTWLMSLRSPAFPGPIDTALAEQGAVLFHSKDLWAGGLNNPVTKPAGGNGSCASCHGAYSPRYVHDPDYLVNPALEGVASYVVPRDLIATDPARVDSDSEEAEQYGTQNFFAYPEMLNSDPDLDCNTQNRAAIRQGRPPGYLAPPLYGVWASAPYFHNGSVPNVWEVLKPADRKTLWRRVSEAPRFDQIDQVVMGYDTDFQRAYDQTRLGWKYDALACGDVGTTPYLDCNPSNQAEDPTLAEVLNLVGASNPLLWYLGLAPTTNQQLEDRKIYNTRQYGQGNGGHAFSAVLTDAERRALVEYLKTL